MTGKEFRERYTEDQLAKIAKSLAGSIVVRDYVGGCSRDTRRATTERERNTIAIHLYAAFFTYWHIGDKGVVMMAEVAVRKYFEYCNTYDTIYLPFMRVIEEE